MASWLNRPAGGSHLIVHRSIDYCNAQLVLHFLIGKFVLPSPHTPEGVESMSVFWATTRHRARHAGGGSLSELSTPHHRSANFPHSHHPPRTLFHPLSPHHS